MHLTNFHFYNQKNYLYSKLVKGLQSCGVAYGFGFNGKELDNETYGEGNAYDFGARIYDPRLGRWLSVDPLFKDYTDLSPYCSMGNNPIVLVDKDGRKIVVYSTKDQQVILKMINSKALGTFGFDKNGELYLKSASGDASKFSTYYRDRLVEAINETNNLIVIDIDQTYLDPADKKQKDVDVVDGGGATLTETQPPYFDSKSNKPVKSRVVSSVIISGNANIKDIKDVNGNVIKVEANETLMHELVAHAIPSTTTSDTGNGVDNDNKARAQTGDVQRQKSPAHVE